MADLLSGVPGPWLLAAVAAFLVVESGTAIGVVLPAATTVLAAGVTSGLGVVPAWGLVVTAASASALGSHLALRRGALVRGPLLGAALRRIDPATRERVATGLHRRAVPTLAACQMLGVLRTVAPRLAAVAGVSPGRHALATVPAALLWSTALVALGHSAGAAYPAVERAVGLAGLPVVVVVAAVVLAVVAGRRIGAGRARRRAEAR